MTFEKTESPKSTIITVVYGKARSATGWSESSGLVRFWKLLDKKLKTSYSFICFLYGFVKRLLRVFGGNCGWLELRLATVPPFAH